MGTKPCKASDVQLHPIPCKPAAWRTKGQTCNPLPLLSRDVQIAPVDHVQHTRPVPVLGPWNWGQGACHTLPTPQERLGELCHQNVSIIPGVVQNQQHGDKGLTVTVGDVHLIPDAVGPPDNQIERLLLHLLLPVTVGLQDLQQHTIILLHCNTVCQLDSQL